MLETICFLIFLKQCITKLVSGLVQILILAGEFVILEVFLLQVEHPLELFLASIFTLFSMIKMCLSLELDGISLIRIFYLILPRIKFSLLLEFQLEEFGSLDTLMIIFPLMLQGT